MLLKKWMLGLIVLSVSLFSHAGLIVSVINGAEMEGIEVTAYFGDGSDDTQMWLASSSTAGGVNNGDWSLALEGDTFGDYDSSTDTFFGLWTLENLTIDSGIIGLSVNAGIANVYFDILEGFVPSTPGSNAGRPFASNAGEGVTASFSDVYSAPDLFGVMDITWNNQSRLAKDEKLLFLTDTDKVMVSEPSMIFVFSFGLLALLNSRKILTGRK